MRLCSAFSQGNERPQSAYPSPCHFPTTSFWPLLPTEFYRFRSLLHRIFGPYKSRAIQVMVGNGLSKTAVGQEKPIKPRADRCLRIDVKATSFAYILRLLRVEFCPADTLLAASKSCRIRRTSRVGLSGFASTNNGSFVANLRKRKT